MEKGKFNGYAQWLVIVIAVCSIIWSASSINSDVDYLKNEIVELKNSHKIEIELLKDEIKELRLEIRVLNQNK